MEEKRFKEHCNSHKDRLKAEKSYQKLLFEKEKIKIDGFRYEFSNNYFKIK